MIKWNEVTWYSKFLAILFFIGVLPVLCFYIGKEYGEVKQQVEMVEIATSEPQEKVATGADIAEWKTYQNEEYKFEFKYPATLKHQENSPAMGLNPIISFSDNKEIDPTTIDVSGPHGFPVDSFEGTGEDTPSSKKLKDFNEFAEHESLKGSQRKMVGGFDTLLVLGRSEFTPTLFVDIGDNKYLYITVYRFQDFGLKNPLYKAIFDSLKKL